MSPTKAPHAYKTFFISSLPLDFLRIKMLRLLRTEFCDTSATIREKYSLIVLVVAVWRGGRDTIAREVDLLCWPGSLVFVARPGRAARYFPEGATLVQRSEIAQ